VPNLTKDQQVKQLVAGLAIAVRARGVTGVPSGKGAIESALSHALGEWSARERFPAVAGFQGPNFLWIGMQRSEGRQGVGGAWEMGKVAEPYLRHDWTPMEHLTAHADDEVSTDEWLEFADLFLAKFPDDALIRDHT
jgi:hypothetical protein